MGVDDGDSLVKKGKSSSGVSAPGGGSGGGLPLGEPGQEGSLEDQRLDLAARIEELSGVLKYMGKGHPDREKTASQLERMQKMLEEMDRAMHG
jgi:hypothetical protein